MSITLKQYIRLTVEMQHHDNVASRIHDQLDEIWIKLSAEDRVRLTQQLVAHMRKIEPHDFEHPDRVAERALCAQEGHLTINELEHTQATHGTRHVCTRCGKFWHGEPLPPEKTNADP